MKFLYNNDVEKISVKCSGVRITKGKEPVSPPKKISMERLLQERVEAEGNGQQMVLERCDRINRLIGDAVYNIQRKGAQNVGLSDVDKLNTANSTASSLQGAYAVQLVQNFGSSSRPL